MKRRDILRNLVDEGTVSPSRASTRSSIPA
jgi:hypothetical protein